MAIVSTKRGEANILALDGRLTMGPSSTALRTSVREGVEGGAKAIILDLTALTYVDSAGLGALAASSSEAKSLGAALILVNLQPRVQQAIELVCLDRVLSIHPSVDAALNSFKASSDVCVN